jgi:type II secretory pathway pseudopilin PulG
LPRWPAFARLTGDMIPVAQRSGLAQKGTVPPRAVSPSRAFSLLELLISMALIITMFVLYYGHSARSYQLKQKLACQQHLQTIFVALQIYAADHGGSFPVKEAAQTSEAPLNLLVPRYTSVTAPFICPGSKDKPLPEGEPLEKHRISYAYYMGWKTSDSNQVLMTDRQVDSLPKVRGQNTFSSNGKKPGNNHHRYGGNYLFSDGRIEMGPAAAPFSLGLTQGVTLLNPKP